MASFEAEIERAKNTNTQKKTLKPQGRVILYRKYRCKKEVIVKNETILKSGKHGHFANASYLVK